MLPPSGPLRPAHAGHAAGVADAGGGRASFGIFKTCRCARQCGPVSYLLSSWRGSEHGTSAAGPLTLQARGSQAGMEAAHS